MRPVLPPRFIAALIVLGISIVLLTVPAPFTVDEDNYVVTALALRQGGVSVANTAALLPSRELLFFDPGPWGRQVTSTPVVSTAPPLYAFIALPFSLLGWRGLVALNTAAFLLTVAMVFWYTRRYSTDPHSPWLAAGAFALCSFTLEYAGGLWPQALSFALCTLGVVAAALAIEQAGIGVALASGLALGIATGVRYQNAVVLVASGAGLALWTWRRPLMAAAFGAGASIPLALSSAVNHARFDSWNPISKGSGYLSVAIDGIATSWMDPFTMFWAHVVDFSVRPPILGQYVQGWVRYDPVTGAHLLMGLATKKALLQSAPWVIIALAAFTASWTSTFPVAPDRRRQIRMMSIVAASLLLTFAAAGVRRHDGLSFNERYLLELLPLASVVLAWSFEGQAWQRRPLVLGAEVTSAVLLVVLLGTPMDQDVDARLWALRQWVILKLPVILAFALLGAWWWNRTRVDPGRGSRALLHGLLGACLGWGLTSHLTTDVIYSRELRATNLARAEAIASVVGDRSAIVAYWGFKDSVGPVLLDRDIVVLDAQVDQGRDAPTLIQQLQSQGRRVFVFKDGFPQDVLDRVLGGLSSTEVERGGFHFLELRGHM